MVQWRGVSAAEGGRAEPVCGPPASEYEQGESCDYQQKNHRGPLERVAHVDLTSEFDADALMETRGRNLANHQSPTFVNYRQAAYRELDLIVSG